MVQTPVVSTTSMSQFTDHGLHVMNKPRIGNSYVHGKDMMSITQRDNKLDNDDA
jgi:hypothetical protein